LPAVGEISPTAIYAIIVVTIGQVYLSGNMAFLFGPRNRTKAPVDLFDEIFFERELPLFFTKLEERFFLPCVEIVT